MSMLWYPWIKAAHIIGMVCWFAGLFYLPRLFVYHAGAEDAVGRDRFALMEARLYRIIMNPAMLATLVFGVWALAASWSLHATAIWLWVKIALVALLLGYHHVCARIMRQLAAGTFPRGERFLRGFNEIPTLILIPTVALAVVKPFQS